MFHVPCFVFIVRFTIWFFEHFECLASDIEFVSRLRFARWFICDTFRFRTLTSWLTIYVFDSRTVYVSLWAVFSDKFFVLFHVLRLRHIEKTQTKKHGGRGGGSKACTLIIAVLEAMVEQLVINEAVLWHSRRITKVTAQQVITWHSFIITKANCGYEFWRSHRELRDTD